MAVGLAPAPQSRGQEIFYPVQDSCSDRSWARRLERAVNSQRDLIEADLNRLRTEFEVFCERHGMKSAGATIGITSKPSRSNSNVRTRVLLIFGVHELK